MTGDTEALRRWGVPFTQRGGVTLVRRCDAAACVMHIIRNGCRFYGYDAFALTADSIQPFLEFSPDWSRGGVPPLEVLLSSLQSDPPEITHYEFVFDPA